MCNNDSSLRANRLRRIPNETPGQDCDRGAAAHRRSRRRPLTLKSRRATRRRVKFEGTLGRMFNLFGGKAAKEGIEGEDRRQGQPQGDADRRHDGHDHRSVGREGLRPRHQEEDVHRDDLRRAAPQDARGRGEGAKKEAEKEEPGQRAGAAEADQGIRGRLRREGHRPEEADRRLRHARDDRHRSPSARRARRSRRAAAW